jgi:hypothetical protein
MMPPVLKHAFAIVTGGSQFALADPGQKYQVTDVVEDPEPPFRRLVFAGVSANKWFVHYELGGIGHSYAMVVFGLEPKGSVLFLWGGVVSERAKNIDDLRKAIARGSFCDDGIFHE